MKILLILSVLLNIALIDTINKKQHDIINLQDIYLDAIDYITYLEEGIIKWFTQ